MLSYKMIDRKAIPEMAKLYIETFNSQPWNEKWTKETAEKRLRQMICVEDFYGLCAYQGDELYGVILGCFEQFYRGMTFNIREFCVKNSSRGKGIGTEIFLHFQKDLKEMGVSELILYTVKGDHTEHFYHNQGFHNIDNLTLMGKKL